MNMKLLFTFLFLSLFVRTASAGVSDYNTGYKWYPGHYALVDHTALDIFMQELQDYPVVRGIQKRYFWEDMEISKDQYDFSQIIADLSYVHSKGKLLVVQIQFKTFNNNHRPYPAYLLTSEYDGGIYEASGKGWNLKLWNVGVLNRFKALLLALGAATDSHPALALVNIAESAAGSPADKELLSNWTGLRNAFMNGLSGCGITMRAAFPNTPTISYFNSNPSDALLFEDVALSTGHGTGGPDVYIGAYEKELHLRHAYDYTQRVAGKVPIGYGVQWNNFIWVGASSAHADPRGAVPPVEHYEFSKEVLKSNFMFWAKRDPYWKDVKALWSNLSFMGDPAGGLKSDCPSMAPSTCSPTQETITPVSQELLVFDFKGSVTEEGKGLVIAQNASQTTENRMPMVPGSNYDWTQPINFHEGTLYLRAEIIKQPKPKQMKLQFFVWQDNLQGDKEGIENSSATGDVLGTTGSIITWDSSIPSFFKKDNVTVDWSRPRESYALVVKNSGGEPVWDLNGANWNGEIPSEWYPLSIRFTAVAVAKDHVFSGWDNYVRAGEYEVPPSDPSSTGELTGYWNFDQMANHTILDDSGNENHLTISGSALQTEGYKGLSLKLDGKTNSMASIEDAALSENFPSGSKGSSVDSLTIASWVYLNAIQERSPILTKEAINNRGFEFGIKNGYLAVQISKNETDVSRLENSGTLLHPEMWYHVAMTYEFVTDGSSVIRVYLNGEEDFSMNHTVGPLKINTAPLRLGAYIWNSSFQRFFNGMIDEVYVYSKVLSQTEIYSLMNSSTVNINPYAAKKTKIELFPNPVNAYTQVVISLEKNANFTLKVFNISGQEMACLINELLPAGKHSIPFSGKELSPGYYFLSLRSDDNLSTIPFVKNE